MSLANATKTHQLYFYTHQKRFEIQCVCVCVCIYICIYVEYEIHIAKSSWKWIAFTSGCLNTFLGVMDPSLLKSGHMTRACPSACFASSNQILTNTQQPLFTERQKVSCIYVPSQINPGYPHVFWSYPCTD